MPALEVPVFSPASARAALSLGASRLEINRAGSYPEGGLTPDEPEVGPLSGSPVPLRIMIRPRGAPPPGGGPDFVYSDAEFGEMRDAIRRFAGCGHLRAERGDGFVFGVLKRREERGGGALVVDVDRSRELVRLARPFACVFHRAFDDVLGTPGRGSSATEEPGEEEEEAAAAAEALQAVAGCGFNGILTSGGLGSAADNIEALSRVLRLAGRPAAAHLEIIVGGGVRSSNVRALRDGLCPARSASGGPRVWFHSSCLTARYGDDVDEEEVGRIVSGLGT